MTRGDAGRLLILTREQMTVNETKEVPRVARFGVLEGGSPSEEGTLVTRTVAMARCLRCGFEWLPRVECPVKCPHCKTHLWNVPRAYALPGKPTPTRKGRPRGRSMPKPQSTEENQTRV